MAKYVRYIYGPTSEGWNVVWSRAGTLSKVPELPTWEKHVYRLRSPSKFLADQIGALLPMYYCGTEGYPGENRP